MREPRRRIFFALWPDAAVRDRIERVTRACTDEAGGRATPATRFHVTLAFLGSVDPAGFACAGNVGATIQERGFVLSLSAVGYWRRSRVLSLQPAGTPSALADLVDALWGGLSACGFEREARKFRPHVTLARNARAPRESPVSIDAIEWEIRDFCLVESVTGAGGPRYTVERRWDLGGQG